MGNTDKAKTEKRVDNRPVYGLKDRVGAWTAYAITAAGIVYATNQWLNGNFPHQDMPYLMDEKWQHTLPPLFLVPYALMVHVLGPAIKGGINKTAESKKKVDAIWVPISKVWNLFLTVLSYSMLFGLIHGLVTNALDNNLTTAYELICDPNKTRWQGSLLFWIWVFTMSKYAELFDTVILVFRGKTPNFLHWYHHITVLLYTWYCVKYQFTAGWVFGSVNCFVHSIMYDYYKVASYGIKLSYDKLVTTIQLLQMVLGILVNVVWVKYHWDLGEEKCPAQNADYMIWSGFGMYASYFLLFGSFYVNRYMKKKSKKA